MCSHRKQCIIKDIQWWPTESLKLIFLHVSINNIKFCTTPITMVSLIYFGESSRYVGPTLTCNSSSSKLYSHCHSRFKLSFIHHCVLKNFIHHSKILHAYHTKITFQYTFNPLRHLIPRHKLTSCSN